MRNAGSLTRRLALGASLLAYGLLAGTAFAQDGSATAIPGEPPEGYPVAVHEGACGDLVAEPQHELDNAISFGSGDNDLESIGPADAVPAVLAATGTIDSSLDDLAETGSAIVVHGSPDDYDTIIACGNVAGFKDDGRLVIALNATGEGTIVGVAVLDEDSAGAIGLGEDEVQATVYLIDTAEK